MMDVHGLFVRYTPTRPPTEAEIAREKMERAKSKLVALEDELRSVEKGTPTARHYPGGDPAALTPSGRVEVETAFEADRAGRARLVEEQIELARARLAECVAEYQRAAKSESRRREQQVDEEFGGYQLITPLPANAHQPVEVEVEGGRGIFGRLLG